MTAIQSLLLDDSFREVARAVDVDAVLERHEVGEELQGDDFENRQKVLGGRSRRQQSQSVARAGDLLVAVIGEGNDACALRLHVGEQLQRFLVAQDGGIVARDRRWREQRAGRGR